MYPVSGMLGFAGYPGSENVSMALEFGKVGATRTVLPSNHGSENSKV